jgi:hypothetical protein
MQTNGRHFFSLGTIVLAEWEPGKIKACASLMGFLFESTTDPLMHEAFALICDATRD